MADNINIAQAFQQSWADAGAALIAVQANVMERIDARLDAIDTQFDAIEARLDGMEARFDELERKISTL
ncbi:hypothetical protein FRC10_007872 [Ceratobasidium sp. 414]|nr:hypothetical protein FRC10_007872 [Ceratobasidium sp. 414]